MSTETIESYDVAAFDARLSALLVAASTAPPGPAQLAVAEEARSLVTAVVSGAPSAPPAADRQWQATQSGGYLALLSDQGSVTAALAWRAVRWVRLMNKDLDSWQIDFATPDATLEGALGALEGGATGSSPAPAVRVRIGRDGAVVSHLAFGAEGAVTDLHDWDSLAEKGVEDLNNTLRQSALPKDLPPEVEDVGFPTQGGPQMGADVLGGAAATVGGALIGIAAAKLARGILGERGVEWYYVDGGKQVGPVKQGQLQKLLDQGRLPADALVWREGMAQWLKASEVGLSAASGRVKRVPPPPPRPAKPPRLAAAKPATRASAAPEPLHIEVSTPARAEPEACPSCGAAWRPGAQFCAGCGGSAAAAKAPDTGPVCGGCLQENFAGARFCRFCGVPLGQPSCGSCWAPLPPGARFCRHCGKPVA